MSPVLLSRLDAKKAKKIELFSYRDFKTPQIEHVTWTDRPQLNQSRAHLLSHTAAWDKHFYMPLQNERGCHNWQPPSGTWKEYVANSGTKPDSRGLLYLGLVISIRTVYRRGQRTITIFRRVSLEELLRWHWSSFIAHKNPPPQNHSFILIDVICADYVGAATCVGLVNLRARCDIPPSNKTVQVPLQTVWHLYVKLN